MLDEIEYLSISGAGTRGAAYIGLLSCFEKYDFLDTSKIKGFSGTSAGSLFALSLLLGLNSKDMFEFISPLMSSFDNIAPVLDISLMITNFGMDNGDCLKDVVRKLLHVKGLSGTVTLENLYAFIPVEFVCVTTNITEMKVAYLSYKTHPKLPVVDAVFMSMCVPFLFAPVDYNNCLFVDGAVIENEPLNFDRDKTLYITVNASTVPRISNWPQYIQRLFACTPRYQYVFKHHLAIFMKANDNDLIDMNINQSTLKRLIATGYVNSLMYIHPNIKIVLEKILQVLINHHLDESCHDQQC
jgi:predicted acylesterase/phospholipase RssA